MSWGRLGCRPRATVKERTSTTSRPTAAIWTETRRKQADQNDQQRTGAAHRQESGQTRITRILAIVVLAYSDSLRHGDAGTRIIAVRETSLGISMQQQAARDSRISHLCGVTGPGVSEQLNSVANPVSDFLQSHAQSLFDLFVRPLPLDETTTFHPSSVRNVRWVPGGLRRAFPRRCRTALVVSLHVSVPLDARRANRAGQSDGQLGDLVGGPRR